MGDFNTSAVNAITNQLRRELLDGTIPAGSRILPKALAARFSVSLVPVREALQHLDAEGLIVTSPQRATFAADIGFDEFAEAYDLRRLVETEYACRSAVIASDTDKRICDQALQALFRSEPNSIEFFVSHREFHWSILRPSAGVIIKNVLERLWQNIDKYVLLGARKNSIHTTTHNMHLFYEDHASIAKAFVESNPEKLRNILMSHFSSNESILKEMLKEVLAKAD